MKQALQLMALALCARAALAQAPAGPTRVEIMAGVNLAKLSGSDGADNRVGLVAGVGLVKPLAPNWSFQPELTYAMKGAKGADETGSVTLKLDYLEMPLLFRYDMMTAGGVYPFIHAGPALALNLSCNFEGTDGTITVSGSCSDTPGAEDVKTFDLGAMFGGGIAFRQMNRTFTVGVRYNLGLLEVSDGSDAKNRVLSFVGTFDWPWGK